MAKLSSPAASVKRKRNDPSLETITIDQHYDLVLIVGTPTHPDGQKAFRVNKGSVRHMSEILTEILTGAWTENSKSEIEFPDDSWKPFEIVLKVAHLQVAELPDFLSFEGLQALAELTDKYNFINVARIGLRLKQWLHKYKNRCWAWPSPPSAQQFASMTSVFQYNSDLAFVTSKLAVEVQFDGSQGFYYHSVAETRLAPSLPFALLANINRIRDEVLRALVEICNDAVTDAILADKKPPCGTTHCTALKVGILVTDLTTAGLHPILEDTNELYGNVLSYWRAIHRIGAAHALYQPCDKLRTPGPYAYTSVSHGTDAQCNYARCIGDFGIKEPAKTMLQQRVHPDVFAHMQTDAFMKATY